jgi:1-acyl-sn-glycerol-3-phosphate acyltransferase
MSRPPVTGAYRTIVTLTGPVVRTWGRMNVAGLDNLPRSGPTLLVGDHDSYWDPIAIAVAAREVRQVRALAKSTLWRSRFGAAVMDSMGHVPIERGASNEEALATAADQLRRGACIGIFPEGTRSLGRPLRARSGVGRLARLVPDAVVVGVRTTGTVDVVRVPRRPTIRVEFFRPTGGPIGPDESPIAYAGRLLDELRAGAPREIPGRRRTEAKYRARLTD